METFEKLDLLKTAPEYYSAKLEPAIIELKEIGYVGIAGQGSPNGDDFLKSIEAIYGVAYKIKNMKKVVGRDFKVAKMEAFWWLANGHDFVNTPMEEWLWLIVIRMPDYVVSNDLELAKKTIEDDDWVLKTKWHIEPAGKYAHILHIGSYHTETESINKIMNHVMSHSFEIAGHHREIYINDPRKTAEDRLKTILRYRVKEKVNN